MRTSSRRWSGVPLLAGLAAAVVLAVAGCGGGSGGSGGSGGGGTDEVASAGNGGTTGVTATKNPASEVAAYIESRRKWVRCLRDEGYDLPDPDAKGMVDFGDNALEWKRDPKFAAAQEKCADLNLPVPDSVERAMQPELSAEEKAQKRQYATCMQENGAPDFPDTGQDGYFEQMPWDPTTPSARRAGRICGPIIGETGDEPAGRG